jgi:hypothetical protein
MHCFFVAGISGIEKVQNVYIQFIIDDILKGAVKTDNNSTKRKLLVIDKTFVTWKEKFPWLCTFVK